MRAAPRAAAGPALCAERKSRRLLDRSHSAPNPYASVAITWPSTTPMLCAGHDMDSAGPLNRNRQKPSERKKDEALPPAERSVGDRANAPPIHARARYLWDHAPSRYGPCISPSADIGPLSPHRRPQRIVAPCSFPRSPPSGTSTTSPAPPTSRGRWSAANSRSARSRSSFGAARNSSGCGPPCTAHPGRGLDRARLVHRTRLRRRAHASGSRADGVRALRDQPADLPGGGQAVARQRGVSKGASKGASSVVTRESGPVRTSVCETGDGVTRDR